MKEINVPRLVLYLCQYAYQVVAVAVLGQSWFSKFVGTVPSIYFVLVIYD